MSGPQDQMEAGIVRKRGRPRKNPIVPASPVSSVTSSGPDATSPVYNIHIHLHSPSGVNSKALLSKIQPIVHLHLDRGTQDSSPNTTPPSAARRRTYRKRAKSPSLSLILTKKKRKGKNDSCCGSEDSETSLNGFNPIYMSTQKKDSGDDLRRCENACDKSNDLEGESCNAKELLHSDNEVPHTNLPVDKTSKIRKSPRIKQNKDVQSDSSNSVVSHKCLRYIMPRTTARANEDADQGKSNCDKSCAEDVIKLKEAVVQLRDLCRSKNIMNNISGGRVTNVSSLVLKDMALRRNPKQACVREGKRIQRSSESESTSSKSRRSSRIRARKSVSDEDNVNGNGLVIASGDDEMSNNSDSEANSQISTPERVKASVQNRIGEDTQGKEDTDWNSKTSSRSLNSSTRNGNMYSMVYTPEKNTPRKRVVLGKKATAIIDKLNFSEIKTRLKSRERRNVTVVSCVDSSSIATDTEERLSPAELTSCDENEATGDNLTQEKTESKEEQLDKSSEQIEKETDSLVETVTKESILSVGTSNKNPVPHKINSRSVEETQHAEPSESEGDEPSVILGTDNSQPKRDFPASASDKAEDSSESEEAESNRSDRESDGESSLSEGEKRRNAEVGRSHFFSPENFDKAATEHEKNTEHVREEPKDKEDSASESSRERTGLLPQERSGKLEQVMKGVHQANTEKRKESSVEDSNSDSGGEELSKQIGKVEAEQGRKKIGKNVANTTVDSAGTTVKKIQKTEVGSENGLLSSDSDSTSKGVRRIRRKKRTLRGSITKVCTNENESSSESEKCSENEEPNESATDVEIRDASDEGDERNSKGTDKSPEKQVLVDKEGSTGDKTACKKGVEKAMSAGEDDQEETNREIVEKDKSKMKKRVDESSAPAKDNRGSENNKSRDETNGLPMAKGDSSENEVAQEIGDFNDFEEGMAGVVNDKARRRAADETSSEEEEGEKVGEEEEDDKCEEMVESESSEDSDVIGCSQKKLRNHKKFGGDVLEERSYDEDERIKSTKVCNGQLKEKGETIETDLESNMPSGGTKSKRKGLKSRNKTKNNRSEESENEDDDGVGKADAKNNELSELSNKESVIPGDDDGRGEEEAKGNNEKKAENTLLPREICQENVEPSRNEGEAQTVQDEHEEIQSDNLVDGEIEEMKKRRKSTEISGTSGVAVPNPGKEITENRSEIDPKQGVEEKAGNANTKRTNVGNGTFPCNGFLDTEDESEKGEMDQEITKIIEFLNTTEVDVKNKNPKSKVKVNEDVGSDALARSSDRESSCAVDTQVPSVLDDVNSAPVEVGDEISESESIKSSKRNKKKKEKKNRLESLEKGENCNVEKVGEYKKRKKEKRKRKKRHRDSRSGSEDKEKRVLSDSSSSFEGLEEPKKKKKTVEDVWKVREEKMPEPEVVKELMTAQRTCDFLDESSSHSGEGRLVIALESDKESVVNNDSKNDDDDRNDGGDGGDDDEIHERKTRKKKKKRKDGEGKSGCELSTGAVASGETQSSLGKSEGKSLREFQSHSTSDEDGERIPGCKQVKMGPKVKNKAKETAKTKKQPSKRKEPATEPRPDPVPVKKAKKTGKKRKEKSEPKRAEKTGKKKYFDGEDYISLNLAGPTKFALAQLDKLKSFEKHDATTFRHRMLFQDRVKRFASPKTYQMYKMKQEAANKCSG